MKIDEVMNLRLCDLTTNHLNESSKKLSQKTIKELSLDELEYLVRQQMWISPLIRICIQKINDNWGSIQVYYPKNELTEWFENIARELILLPKVTWDIDKVSFYKLINIINNNKCRTIKLEDFIINNFLNYSPNDLLWNDEQFNYFEEHINSHHGEVLKALKLIQDYVICLNNDGQIKYNRNNKCFIINNLTDFKELILDELSENKEELMYWLKDEHKIEYY